MAQMAWTRHAGQKKNNITSVTLVNNTLKTIDVTVPSGKQWLLLSIRVVNSDDVTRAISVLRYQEAGKTNLLDSIVVEDVGAGGFQQMPNRVTGNAATIGRYSRGAHMPTVMDGGETISVIWAAGGASTGATDADGLVIEILEVALSA